MNVSQFIVLDKSEYNPKRKEASYAISGMRLFPIGKPLPIIVSGVGCVALGTITKLTMTADITTVEYKVDPVIKEHAVAYYSLYRMQSSSSNSIEDMYDNYEDDIVPGMMTQLKQPSDATKRPKYGTKPNKYANLSLRDFADDDDRW
jgi:hypothetical protein